MPLNYPEYFRDDLEVFVCYLWIPLNGYNTSLGSFVENFDSSLFILGKIDFDYFGKTTGNLSGGPAKMLLNTFENILKILPQDFPGMLLQALRDPSLVF